MSCAWNWAYGFSQPQSLSHSRSYSLSLPLSLTEHPLFNNYIVILFRTTSLLFNMTMISVKFFVFGTIKSGRHHAPHINYSTNNLNRSLYAFLWLTIFGVLFIPWIYIFIDIPCSHSTVDPSFLVFALFNASSEQTGVKSYFFVCSCFFFVFY